MNNQMIQQSTQIQAQSSSGKTMQQLVKSMEGEIKKALPTVLTPERFTRIVLSALSTTPKLGTCTPKSFLAAMMAAAALGLECNTPLGQAYLIPRDNRKTGTTDCVFELGYKGLVDLAYRSGDVASIQAQAVYKNDFFEIEYGLEPKLVHRPAITGRGEPIAVYAIVKTTAGGYTFGHMSMEDALAFAKEKSDSYRKNAGPWVTDPVEMAKKTILKNVLKLAPLKSDFQRGLAQDGAVRNEVTSDILDAPAETAYEDQTDSAQAQPAPAPEQEAPQEVTPDA